MGRQGVGQPGQCDRRAGPGGAGGPVRRSRDRLAACGIRI